MTPAHFLSHLDRLIQILGMEDRPRAAAAWIAAAVVLAVLFLLALALNQDTMWV